MNAWVSAGVRGGVPVLRIGGEIDRATAPGVRDELLRWLEPAAPVAVLDLTGVVFLASNGLALLAELAQHADRCGVVLAIAANQRAVLKPLDITGMHELFLMCPDLDHAVEAVRDLSKATANGG